MGDCFGIQGAVGLSFFKLITWVSCLWLIFNLVSDRKLFQPHRSKTFAPGEAQTHSLQIMRLTRCLLRYGGLMKFNRVVGLTKRQELLMPEWVSLQSSFEYENVPVNVVKLQMVKDAKA